VGEDSAHPPRHEGRRSDSKAAWFPARIEGRSEKVEERNFEVRKNLLEYDEVMDEQRKRIYSYRQRILDGINCRDLITEMIGREGVDAHRAQYLSPTYGSESFGRGPPAICCMCILPPRTIAIRNSKTPSGWPVDEASRMAESQVLDAIEENLPDEEDQSE